MVGLRLGLGGEVGVGVLLDDDGDVCFARDALSPCLLERALHPPVDVWTDFAAGGVLPS